MSLAVTQADPDLREVGRAYKVLLSSAKFSILGSVIRRLDLGDPARVPEVAGRSETGHGERGVPAELVQAAAESPGCGVGLHGLGNSSLVSSRELQRGRSAARSS